MEEKESLKLITKHLSKDLREKIAKSIAICEITGMRWADGLKAGLVRKTRSKKSPYVATDYGILIMKTTKIGQTYLKLGQLG